MKKWLRYYLPNIWESLLLVLIFFFAGALFVGALLVLIPQSREVLLSNMLLQYLLPMIPVFAYIILRGYSSYKNARLMEFFSDAPAQLKAPAIEVNAPVGREEGRKSSWFVIGVVLFVGALASGFAIDPIMSNFEFPEALKQVYEKMNFSNIDYFISIVIMAPLCEEFIFRGTILRGLISKQLPIVAIILSSILFGLIHLNFLQGVGGFIIGLFMGYAYYKTHSIWAAIFVHFVNNGSSYILVSLLPKECATTSLKELLSFSPNLYYVVVVLGIILTLLSVWLLYKLLPQKNSFKVHSLPASNI